MQQRLLSEPNLDLAKKYELAQGMEVTQKDAVTTNCNENQKLETLQQLLGSWTHTI